MAADSFHVLFV